MQKFIGVKIIHAVPMNRGEYNEYRNFQIPQDEDPSDEGYLVEYEPDPENPSNHPGHEGYISWSPKAAFEKAYRKAKGEGLQFGLAIEALKRGRRVARKGWNEKGMFLFLLPAGKVPVTAIHDPILKKVIIEELSDNGNKMMPENPTFDALGSIRMWTADKKVLTGWLASQTDMLAEDWEILG